MFTKKIIFILTLTSLCSCTYFDFKKNDRHAIAKQQLNEIKSRSLDTYPLLNPCDDESQKASKKCFEQQIVAHIYSYFDEAYIMDQPTLKDTLWVQINVSKKGNLTLKAAQNATDFSNFNFIEEKLKQALLDASPIQPAIVRGFPVASVFKLPLIIDNK
ncbi:hypothetical protein [Aquimarina agarivorans]|uniref:hypothetical protein n=1 Tax=Aquimarina agarivorans TaxID=980584 RepID=UPI000590C5B0|nr:hypothetical protein [Aquimarina agarivorans]